MQLDPAWLLGTLLSRNLLTGEEAASLRERAGEDDVVPLMLREGLLTERQLVRLHGEYASGLPGTPNLPGYRILELVRQGGMATVYRAVQERMERTVALKVFDSREARSRLEATAFLKEARLAARINHPNIVTVHDAGAFGSWLYCSMELVNGGDADDLARRHGGRLPLQRSLEVIWDAARGLEALHERHILHRDIKPANILIGAGGVAKLSDFGLACLAEDQSSRVGTVVGTPHFIAPELLEGVKADERCDIYGLGATLFTLLAGHPPYEADNVSKLLVLIGKSDPPDPQEHIPDLPPDVAELLRILLSKKPEVRPSTASDLAMALESLIRLRINARMDPRTTAIFRRPSQPGLQRESKSTPLRIRKGPALRDQESMIVHLPRVLESQHYGGADRQMREHVQQYPRSWILLDARQVTQVLSTDMAFYCAWHDLAVGSGGSLAVIGMQRQSYERCQVLGLNNVVPFFSSLEAWYRSQAASTRDSTWSLFPSA